MTKVRNVYAAVLIAVGLAVSLWASGIAQPASASADSVVATSTPLTIDSITSVDTTGVADNTFSHGWKWIIHFTVPTNEDAFRIKFTNWGNASFMFPTGGNVRISSAQSSNAPSPSNAFLMTGNGYSDWLYLTGDASSAPGRQVDLVVEVKIPTGTLNGSYGSTFTAQTYPSNATSTATP